MNRTNIYLTGFMASGKSSVGEELAKDLGLSFLDLDELIRLAFGYSPAQIIQEHGEEYFRKLERKALKKATSLRGCVVALGGGTALDEKSWKMIKNTGIVIWLKANPGTISDRLKEGLDHRPLFDSNTYVELMKKREKWYMRADLSVDTDAKVISKVVEDIKSVLAMDQKKFAQFYSIRKILTKSAPPYEVVLSNSLATSLDKMLSKLFVHDGLCEGKDKAIVVTSPVLKCLYGFNLEEALSRLGVKMTWFLVDDGESVKKLKIVEKMYETSAKIGLAKNSVVISLGGGSIGDVSGFFASTYCRGLSFIQVPTTLLAMADSSVGGKNALNLAEGKNLVGTIWQPSGVAIGTEVLMTLKEEELSFGMAEIVKAAIIGDKDLFEIIERNSNMTEKVIDWPDLSEIISRAIEVKADLVEIDERDFGERRLLNLGHTTAHALEALSKYEGMSHGQAVSIGIAASAKLSVDSGKLSGENEERIKNLLKKLNLPIKLESMEITDEFTKEFEMAISLDKKNVGEKMNIVIPVDIGKCIVTSEYDKIDLIKALMSLMG